MQMDQPRPRRTVVVIGTRGYPSYYGGFETAVRRIAPALADGGWDVVVYGRPGATRPECSARDHRVRTVETRGIESKSLSTLTYGLTAVLHALREKPDVALVMNVANGFWLPLLRLRGIPTLVNVDGIEWDRAKWNPAAKAVFRAGARMTARWATQILVDARAIGDRWRREFGREGLFAPYGGDDTPAQPVEPGLTPRGYALFVARFVPENTVAEFLEAAATIAEHHDVVIVGSSGYGGELDDAAAALAERNPRVHWLGHLSDDRRLHALWQHAGAYFHGHSVGGTNPALVQAMMLGAPTVARDTVYNREVLGDAARYVTPDAATIASTVLALLADPRLQSDLAADARRRAESEYTWPIVCGRYVDALGDLAAAGPEARR